MADNDFLGIGMKFPPEIDEATGRFKTSSLVDSVRESLYIILMTQHNERLLRPGFGADLESYTFMDVNATQLSMLQRDLLETIGMQEPRITDVTINMDQDIKNGALIIDLSYAIISENVKDNLVFPFYLNAEKPEEMPEEYESGEYETEGRFVDEES